MVVKPGSNKKLESFKSDPGTSAHHYPTSRIAVPSILVTPPTDVTSSSGTIPSLFSCQQTNRSSVHATSKSEEVRACEEICI